MAQRRRLADRIVDTAIEIAEDVGWGNLRLRLVAERLDISLAGVHQHYRDLDAVADAWFRRAWAAMLAPPPAVSPGVRQRPARRAWGSALAHDGEAEAGADQQAPGDAVADTGAAFVHEPAPRAPGEQRVGAVEDERDGEERDA